MAGQSIGKLYLQRVVVRVLTHLAQPVGQRGDLDLSDLTVTDTPGNNLTLDQIKAGLGSAVYTEEGGAVKIAGSNFTKNTDGTYSFSYTTGYAEGTAESIIDDD